MSEAPEFQKFPKVSRWSREVVVTEKIDGTNGQIHVMEDGAVFAGSRSQYLLPFQNDNFGFGRWVHEHSEELRALGPGRHFGEWWGQGIQRSYGLKEKRFSLFNVGRWNAETPPPACCGTVPVLYKGPNVQAEIERCLEALAFGGSAAAPGFTKPEGIVIFHTAANMCFKKTIEKDAEPKSKPA